MTIRIFQRARGGRREAGTRALAKYHAAAAGCHGHGEGHVTGRTKRQVRRDVVANWT